MAVTPYDDPGIFADDRIIRRIDIEEHIVPDNNTGGHRISTKAFRASSGHLGGMSVDLEALIVKNGVDPKHFVTNPKFMGSVFLYARELRALGFWIGLDPIAPTSASSGNPYHGEVWHVEVGDAAIETKQFTKAQQRQLARLAAWYVQIPGVSLG